MDRACIFCDIIAKKIPAAVVLETDHLIAIKDRTPKAPIHYLLIPKKHIENIKHLEEHDIELAGRLVAAARTLAERVPAPHDFRLIANNGASVGQSVFHLHFHFLAGTTYTDL